MTGTAPPVTTTNTTLKLSCNGDQFYSWDGFNRELWSIKLTPDIVATTSTLGVATTPTNSHGGSQSTSLSGSKNTDSMTSTSNSTQFPSGVPGSSPGHTATIAAGIVGGLGAISALAILFWFLRRRHTRHQRLVAGVSTAAYANAKMSMAMTAQPGPRFSFFGGFGSTQVTAPSAGASASLTQITSPLRTVPNKRWSDAFTSSTWSQGIFHGLNRPPSMHVPSPSESRTDYLIDNFTMNCLSIADTIPRRYYRPEPWRLK